MESCAELERRRSSISVLNPVDRECTRWSGWINDAKWTWRSVITGLGPSLSGWLARALSGHAGWLSITPWAAQLTESGSGTAPDDREPGRWRKLAKGRGIGRINPRPAAFPPRGDAKYIRANGKSHNRTAQLRSRLRLTIKQWIVSPFGYSGVHSKRVCDFCRKNPQSKPKIERYRTPRILTKFLLLTEDLQSLLADDFWDESRRKLRCICFRKESLVSLFNYVFWPFN